MFNLGFSTLLLTLGLVGGLVWTQGPGSFTYIYNHWIGIISGSLCMAIIQATYCHLSSFRPGALLTHGGNTGNHVYDVRFLLNLAGTSHSIHTVVLGT